ncbi:STAS domain-containing protein [Pseudoxanthomonas winnipegensis]|jgi:phospholipid transport system transporter-binding protein|uniref:STAS domain-containing protein n=1 Tax=Pseudoxanthomonas winnipegensis TaxID=2480810 RepID=A0A4Q8LBD7_9GAMM|nr:STAS domain-containing protein [Pseudoxanthomonas winnipegensis]TAA25815.1 STAS domain-containing protein [Pseudoxanthomonas winnipegensis]
MSDAAVRRDGPALVFTGALDRAAAQALWPAAQRALDGAQRLDVSAVSALDSAGLALLVALAARLRAAGSGAVTVEGAAPGLAELCAAYRLTPALDYQPA